MPTPVPPDLVPTETQVQAAVDAWTTAARAVDLAAEKLIGLRLERAARLQEARDLIDRQDIAAGRTPTQWPDIEEIR